MFSYQQAQQGVHGAFLLDKNSCGKAEEYKARKEKKKNNQRLSALQRFPSDEADRKCTQIIAEAVGEILSCHLQYMHLPEVFFMFTYSRADTAVKIILLFFFSLKVSGL